MPAVATTVLDIMNKILLRMRESPVSDVDQSEYADTILGFINDAKREVEEAFNWDALHDTIDVNTIASTSTYSVKNVSSNKYTSQRTRVLDVYNVTQDKYLVKTSRDAIRIWVSGTPEENEPLFYSPSGYDSTQNYQVELYQTPNAVYTLRFGIVNPQDELTVKEDYLKVPWHPVFLRALFFAIQERGEDAGATTSDVFTQYMHALNTAIAYEQRQKFEGTTDGDWYVP